MNGPGWVPPKVKEMIFPVAVITIMLIAAVLMYYSLTGGGEL